MIKEHILKYRLHHENVLKQIINETYFPAELIKEATIYALFPGGKRLRPILVYLFGEIVGVCKRSLDLIAASVELIHIYSLIHDDLPSMDNDDFRRNLPSCHRAFNEATAILVGDGMQALAIEILIKNLPNYLPATKVLAIACALLDACGPSGMISGQSMDISELSRDNINLEKLYLIHSLKTTKLFLACLNMVIAAADYPPPFIIDVLNEYTYNLGMVFQMQDDFLDRYSNPTDFGKRRASDLANKKFTFANFYSKNELLLLMKDSFKKMELSLSHLGEKGSNLKDFTQFLQQRTVIY